MFEPGRVIANRYEVVRRLGEGGMGVVYLVKDRLHRDHDREVALKLVHPWLALDAEAMRRFEQEVITCQDLSHPNIVNVFDLHQDGDLRFFTMEYVPGESLRAWLEQRRLDGQVFSLAETWSVIDPVLAALDYAHNTPARTVHRDIKPENVMIVGEFPEVQVRVLDFGIAKTLSSSVWTRSSHVIGTAYYIAPEQRRNPEAVDPRADLYSVGMMVYEMLTGEMAEGAWDPPSELVSALPAAVDKLVRTALKRQPKERFATAAEFRQVLAGLAPGDGPVVVPGLAPAEVIYCPLCGRKVGSEFFRCLKCEREHLCLDHYNEVYRCCEECAAPLVEADKAGNKEEEERQAKIDLWLSWAREALKDNSTLGEAYEYYSKVIAESPYHTEALEGIQKIVKAVNSRMIEVAVTKDDTGLAKAVLEVYPNTLYLPLSDGVGGVEYPLERAIYLGHMAVAEVLLSKGADPNIIGKNDQMNRQQYTAICRKEEVATLLRKYGSDPENFEGFTEESEPTLDDLLRELEESKE